MILKLVRPCEPLEWEVWIQASCHHVNVTPPLPSSLFDCCPPQVLVNCDKCASERAQLDVPLFCNILPAQREDRCWTRRHLCVKYGINIVVGQLESHRPRVCTGNTLIWEQISPLGWLDCPSSIGVRWGQYCRNTIYQFRLLCLNCWPGILHSSSELPTLPKADKAILFQLSRSKFCQ